MATFWNRINTLLLLILVFVVVGALASRAWGGPLDPPAPPASSPGGIDGRIPLTQSDCCPLTISASGSYYLKSDLVLASPQPEAVLITASDVTLDLNGFRIEAANFGDGIVTSGSLTRVTIRNGSVVRALGHAVNLGSTVQAVLQDLNVQQNQPGTAISAGEAAAVRDVTVWATVGSGMSLGPVADVQDCTVDGFGNANAGTVGLQVGIHSSVDRCSVAYFNIGISAGPLSRISNCITRFEDKGVTVGDTSTVEHCTSDTTTTAGIETGVASRVSDCDVRNGLVGVRTNVGSTVERCTVGSVNSGIFLQGNSVAEDNEVDTVTGAGGGGISTVGSGDRIEGNHVINVTGSYAINLTVAGTATVFRNSFHDNLANIHNGAGNDVGPIATAASATSPWANISY